MKTAKQTTEARLIYCRQVIVDLRRQNRQLRRLISQRRIKTHADTDHLSFAEAEIRARQIYSLRRGEKSHEEIARILGIKRDLVSYYLTPKCKAAWRAGLR